MRSLARISSYRVVGPRASEFPLTMLRRADSWPSTDDDATAIHRTLLPELLHKGDGPTTVLLSTHHPLDGLTFLQCAQRWASFGWRVWVRDPKVPGEWVEYAADVFYA